MPRLLIFAACEKVITSKEDNAGSLISLLQGFDIPVAPPADDNVMAPVSWYAFSLWEAINEEPGRFVQRMALIAPDTRTELMTIETPVVGVDDRDKRFHRNAIRHHGFVLRGIGDYMLRIWLRDGDADFIELADRAFPIPVSVPVPQPAAG